MKKITKIVLAAVIIAGTVGIVKSSDTQSADPGGGGRIIPTSVKADM